MNDVLQPGMGGKTSTDYGRQTMSNEKWRYIGYKE
jgi:hypothetical protein